MKIGRNILLTEKIKNLFKEQRSILVSVLGEGLEPSRTEVHRILSPVRLPIPPSEHCHVTYKGYKISYYFSFFKIFLQKIIAETHYKNININLNYLMIENVY